MGLVVSIELAELVELAGLAVVVEVVFVVAVAAPALHFQQVLHKTAELIVSVNLISAIYAKHRNLLSYAQQSHLQKNLLSILQLLA